LNRRVRRRSPLLASLYLAVTASAAWAGAGGGSSGFSGGGSSGGGGYSGGGYSGGGSGTGWNIPSAAAIGIFVALVLVMVVVGAFITWVKAMNYRRRRRERAGRVETAAAEAAEDDEDFAADKVRAAAGDLYLACQAAWSKNDIAALEQMVGADLMVEWRRRLADFEQKGWHNIVEVQGHPAVEYLGLVNRAGEADDRIVCRICATQDDYVKTKAGATIDKTGATTTTVDVEEWWTLAQHENRWIVVSIEQEAEGAHNLAEAIIARPDADDERLHDEATVEVAQDDAAPADVKTADIADLDFDGDARAAAMDLALADARFAPDVLEVAVRRAVAGWSEAIDGADDALLAVAEPGVAHRLLYPDGGDKRRMVVRGPHVEQVRITALDAKADPARMTVELTVSGRRYVEDRDTAAVVSGSKDDATRFTERWTLAIDGPVENPWRIVDASRDD
jgi:predicted lipid-binding transport protein (Tim44 family)